MPRTHCSSGAGACRGRLRGQETASRRHRCEPPLAAYLVGIVESKAVNASQALCATAVRAVRILGTSGSTGQRRRLALRAAGEERWRPRGGAPWLGAPVPSARRLLRHPGCAHRDGPAGRPSSAHLSYFAVTPDGVVRGGCAQKALSLSPDRHSIQCCTPVSCSQGIGRPAELAGSACSATPSASAVQQSCGSDNMKNRTHCRQIRERESSARDTGPSPCVQSLQAVLMAAGSVLLHGLSPGQLFLQPEGNASGQGQLHE